MSRLNFFLQILVILFMTTGRFCIAQEVWGESGAEPDEMAKIRQKVQNLVAPASKNGENLHHEKHNTAFNRPKEIGEYYDAVIPDTLDLAERARWGVNHFTEIISEEHDYEMFWRGDFDQSDMWAWPGHMWFQLSPLQACQPKAIEALVMDRIMSGSRQNLSREGKMLEMMVSHLGEDGLYYVLPHGGKKPWMGTDNTLPRANVHGQGRMLRAMIAWYQYSGNSKWKSLIDRMVNGIDKHLVIHKDDYAYVPTGGWIETDEYCRSSYTKRGWKSVAEPINEKKGEEGSLFNHQGHLPGALSSWYALTGNEQAIRLAGELTCFLTKPQFWADAPNDDYPGVVGAEHAHFRGHFHGHINALRAILEYAVATNDVRLMQFVRDGYEWARQAGLARIGIIGDGQGCGLGRLIGLAVKLSREGIGDYWEDVDLYIRNHGSESQLIPEDIPHLEALIAKNPSPEAPPEMVSYLTLNAKYPAGIPEGNTPDRVVGTDHNIINASMGAFTMAYPPFKTGWALCCSPHGNMGLFYAWDGILRLSEGVVRVNLLLNRASPWLDIDSYLPYQGKVVIKNKQAKEVFVRIPLWVNKERVQCRIGKESVSSVWFGRYVRLTDMQNQDVITVEFPMEEREEVWTSPQQGQYLLPLPPDRKYCMTFRGNTVTKIDPPIIDGSWLYKNRAEKHKTTNVPMKNVRRYISPVQLKW